jgi:hypothetical protein
VVELGLTDTCSGPVSFRVEEASSDSSESEEEDDTGDAGPPPSITGIGSCSFSPDGALSTFVAAGILDSLGPFEGETTGWVLDRPDSSGAIVIDTSIGEIAAEWTGVFSPASDDAAAGFNGDVAGSLDVDASEVMPGLSVIAIDYEGSFTATRTGDLPEDDTGSPDPDGADDDGADDDGADDDGADDDGADDDGADDDGADDDGADDDGADDDGGADEDGWGSSAGPDADGSSDGDGSSDADGSSD